MSSTVTLESRLLLACARTAADRHEVARLVASGPDWEVVVRTAQRWRVVPLADAHLRPVDGVPADIAKRLRQLSYHETVHGMARRALLRTILARLAEAEVSVIVLKGAALSALVYPSPALRPIRNIDLLVPDDAQHRVAIVLSDLWHGKGSEASTAAGLEADARNPYLRPGALGLIDIRSDIFNAGDFEGVGAVGPLAIRDFWARAWRTHIESIATLVLSPEDQLLHLAFHLAVVARFDRQVKLLSDIGEICRCYQESLDWAALVSRAGAYGIGTPLYFALRLAHEMVAAPVPSHALAALESRLGPIALEAQLGLARRSLLSDAPPPEAASSADQPVAAVPATPRRARSEAADNGRRPQLSAGGVAVTYDQGVTDGVGSQLHRILGFYALARALGLPYVHSPIREVGYQGLMPLLDGRLDPAFTARYNAFFSLPSDDFDLEGCERVRLHSVDQEAVERYQEQAADTGCPVLIQGHLPFQYINRHPAGYQLIRPVSPYRGFRPTGPVRVCIHLRRGDNSVQGRERFSIPPLPNSYFLQVTKTVVEALHALGVPFVVRLHTEVPPRPYTLHPGMSGVYFILDRPSMIDPADYALEEFEVIPNLEMVLNVEPRECLDDFATADILVLSRSSLGFVGGLLNPHGCVVCPAAFHAALPDWLVASREGVVDAAQLADRLARQLRDRH